MNRPGTNYVISHQGFDRVRSVIPVPVTAVIIVVVGRGRLWFTLAPGVGYVSRFTDLVVRIWY